MNPVNTNVSQLQNQTYYKSSSLWSGFSFKFIFLVKFTGIIGRQHLRYQLHLPKHNTLEVPCPHKNLSFPHLHYQSMTILIQVLFLTYQFIMFLLILLLKLSHPLASKNLLQDGFKILWTCPHHLYLPQGDFLIAFLSSQAEAVAWRYSVCCLCEHVRPQPHKDKNLIN